MSRSLAEDTSNHAAARQEPPPRSHQRVVVRAIACWKTRAEFVRHEAKCFMRGHLSLLHADPPAVGTNVNFEVRLAQGAVALKGTGTVVAAAPHGAIPVGTLSQASAQPLAIRVEQVTASTKQLLRELLNARRTSHEKRARSQAPRSVSPPPDREALLQRLRERRPSSS